MIRGRALSLHRLIGLGAGVLAAATVVAIAAVAIITSRSWNRVQRETGTVAAEQATAERIVREVQDQVLLASYYVREPHPAFVVRFRERGDQVFLNLREYLFRDLSAEERAQVELLKTMHEEMEATAQLAFELVRRGDQAHAGPLIDRMVNQSLKLHDDMDRLMALRRDRLESLKADQRRASADMYVAMVLLGAMFLATVLVLTRALRQRLLGPLGELSRAAARLGAGELGARVAPAHQDELSVVGESFNRMADRLQEARGELETRNHELARAVETLRKTQQEVVQAEKMTALGGMLAGLAHELNNPLASVLGYAEMLRQRIREAPDGPAGAWAAELAEPIVTEALRARDLVRGMLQFSRTAGAALGPVALDDALAVVVGLRRYSFAQASLALETAVEPGLWVIGEDQRLQQVLLNLVNNAYDALAGGGGSTLRIGASASGRDWVEMTVGDDGPGLAEPARIFDPFYTTKPVGEGTGLGLSLAHRMVSDFGGTIEAFDRPEGGACFVLRLRRAQAPIRTESTDTAGADSVPTSAEPQPVATAAVVTPPVVPVELPPPEPVLAAKPSPAPAQPAVDARPTANVGAEGDAARRRRVLVVDDEEPIRNLQRRILGRLGVEVLTASSGSEAESVLRSEPVDMVVSDVKMPGALSGVDLYRWVRRELPELAERFLFITGDVYEPSIAELAAAAPDRFLAKPFQADEYMAHIRRVLATVA
jgi:signal transduction histidine kinase/ActR/RegA family two-component response regulator